MCIRDRYCSRADRRLTVGTTVLDRGSLQVITPQSMWQLSAKEFLLLYLGLTFAGAAVISAAEGLPLGACLYETASAAGTVGLTLGLTPQWGTLSQSCLLYTARCV